MNVTIETNAKQVTDALNGLFARQVPFALSRALNSTALEVQHVQRAHDRTIFRVRNARFIDQAVKIRREDFATKGKLEAIVRIEPPGGQARADIITKFEQGGLKTSRGGRSISVPVGVRLGPGGVPLHLRPGKTAGERSAPGLGFKPHGRSGRVFKGAYRTFMIRTSQGGLILQRTGKGRVRSSDIRTKKTAWRGRRSDARVLFALERSVPVRASLDFHLNARTTVGRVFPEDFAREFAAAVRTAR